jgi:hypothetical protein
MFIQTLEARSKDDHPARNPHHVAVAIPHYNARQIHLQTTKPDALACHLCAFVSRQFYWPTKTAEIDQQA